MTAIFLFDRDDYRQIKDLVSQRLSTWSKKGLRKLVLALFAMLWEDIIDFVHFLGWQKLSILALMARLAALFTFALCLGLGFFHTRWIRAGRA